MRWRSPRTVDCRAVLAVAALYALLLRAFLGFAAPIPTLDPTGVVLCAEHPGGAPGDQAPADCHPCCTLVHAVAVAVPPPVVAMVVRPRFDHAPVGWRPEATIPKTGPPVYAASARGPPTA